MCTYISLDTSEMNISDTGEMNTLNINEMDLLDTGRTNIISLLWVLFHTSYVSNLIFLLK